MIMMIKWAKMCEKLWLMDAC